ncbi:MAG: glycosyltransferase family 2 protein [Candidatus Omnitrophica bacterium]|nr:glycosyltransferase family 2 protein [Candidatus Omnitrophota bacterium]
MKLSIIIPTYNEQHTIKELINYVQSVEYPIEHEIVIIDDASTDRTYEKEFLIKLKNKSKEHNIRVFKNRINCGKGFSIRKGIKRANGNIIIIQDADMEYNPNEIPRLLEPILKNEVDVVYGSRFLHKPHPDGMASANWLANKIVTKLANVLYNIKLTDVETCYKAFKAESVKKIRLRANRFTFDPEITAILAKKRIKIKELPITYHGRTSKKGKKIRPKDLVFAVLMLLWQRVIH